MYVCALGYRQGRSRGLDYSGVDLDPPDSGVVYRGDGSRKLPYPAYYRESRKTSEESNPDDRQDLDRIDRDRRDLDRRDLERRDRDRRDLDRRDPDRRDLDRRRGGGGGAGVGGIRGREEGYLPDSAESGSTDADTYDSQNMEV